MTDDQVRIGTAEREAASAELGEHYAQGRVTAEEYSERHDRIWAAKTQADLAPIFRDLPSSIGRRAPASPASGSASGWSAGWSSSAAGRRPWGGPARMTRGVPLPLKILLGVLMVALVVTHLPLILVVVAVWFLLVRHGSRHWGVRRW